MTGGAGATPPMPMVDNLNQMNQQQGGYGNIPPVSIDPIGMMGQQQGGTGNYDVSMYQGSMMNQTTQAPTGGIGSLGGPMYTMANSTATPTGGYQTTSAMTQQPGAFDWNKHLNNENFQAQVSLLPPELAPHYAAIANAAAQEAGRTYTPYLGQRIAGFTPNEMAAQQMLTAYGMSGTPQQMQDAYALAGNAGFGLSGLTNQLGANAQSAYSDMAGIASLLPQFRQEMQVAGENAYGSALNLRDRMLNMGMSQQHAAQTLAPAIGQFGVNAAAGIDDSRQAFGQAAGMGMEASDIAAQRATSIADQIGGDLYNQYLGSSAQNNAGFKQIADAYGLGPNSLYAGADKIGAGGFNRIGQIGRDARNQQEYLDADMGAYMDPYAEQVVRNRENAAMQRGRQMISELGSQAAMQGAFGGSRQAVLEQGIASDTMRQMDEIRNAGMSDAFNNAQQAFERDRGARQWGIGQNLAAQQAAEGSLQYGLGAQDMALQGRLNAMNAAAGQDQFKLQGISSLLGQKLQAEAQADEARRFGVQNYANMAGQDIAARQTSGQMGMQGLQANLDALMGGYGANLGAIGQGLGADQAGFNSLMASRQAGMDSVGQQAGILGQGNQLAQGFTGQQLQGYNQMPGIASLLQNLGQNDQAMQLQRIQALEGVGQQQRALQQAGLDMGYQDFQRQRDYGQQQLGFYNNILRGMPVNPSSVSTQQVQQPGLFQSMFSAGVGGLGLYNAMNSGRQG